MTLTITGTIVDKEGKPIDKTHAEWMVRQFLTLLKWCGLHFDGSVSDAQRTDIYRTGVVDVPALDIEKPLRVRHKYARTDVKPALHVVKSEATEPESTQTPTLAELHTMRRNEGLCTPGTVCYVEGRVTKVCGNCTRHVNIELVGPNNRCVACAGK